MHNWADWLTIYHALLWVRHTFIYQVADLEELSVFLDELEKSSSEGMTHELNGDCILHTASCKHQDNKRRDNIGFHN